LVSDSDANFRRAEDQKWRDRTEERIVNLIASEASQNDRLKDVDDHLIEIDELLEGKSSERADNGLKGDIQDLQRGLTKLNALMAPDNLGNGGLINRLKALEKRDEREQKSDEYKWKFRLAILGFIATTAAAILTNVDKIESLLHKRKSQDPVEQMIWKTKHPKPRHSHVKPAEIPPDSDSSSSE
jgi:hypothetical protein